jgi:pyruvate kinase
MSSSIHSRKVKIVCTLGPSSNHPEVISKLIDEGMDVARLNFSHGDHEVHRTLRNHIREAAKKARKPIAILQDLQGPKLRVGKLSSLHPAGIELKPGDQALLYPEGSAPASDAGKILIPISAEIAQAVSKEIKKGALILFDDGRIITEVIHVSPPEITIEVSVGGQLTDHKGMNLPGTPLSIPCVTEKDIEDLKFGLSLGVDAVALSFVRAARDIETIRKQIARLSTIPPLLIAKIEREEAIGNQDSIIKVSDGLLIARGDMAVELGAERVPTIQKGLIRACNHAGVSVITATQMLESMMQSPTPTRAEASDVANAVFDGTDAVMLSGETASGKYPTEVVRTMVRIVMEAERASELYGHHKEILPRPNSTVESIEFSASRIANHVGAVAIACLTHSGMAARTLSKYRPHKPIVAIMDDERMLRKLSFYWGVRGALIPKILGTDDLFSLLEEVLIREGWAELEDLIVVTAGLPTLRRGTTNMVKVHRLGATSERSRQKT